MFSVFFATFFCVFKGFSGVYGTFPHFLRVFLGFSGVLWYFSIAFWMAFAYLFNVLLGFSRVFVAFLFFLF